MSTTSDPDPRRSVPRTDAVLADARLVEAAAWLNPDEVRTVVRAAQQRARAGHIPATVADVADEAVALLPHRAASLHPVINATGVVVHTNLGRAPLSGAAVEAVVAAAGYTDVELDLVTGRRAPRGVGALSALCAAVPDAQDVLVVNNGAAALLLAVTALASGREVVVSRGELVEIGDGFRLPDLMSSAGARLREVGTTNRTSLADYAAAIGPDTGCVVKIHPSNFQVQGFTSSVEVGALASLRRPDGSGLPLVADIGSGLLAPDRQLPGEPDATTALRAGAGVVTASGDKLLGGPQAGIVLGATDLVERMRRHPMARALRVDKLTLAALEATLRGPAAPVTDYRLADPERLRVRASVLADRLGGRLRRHDGLVGGGGAPGVTLPGWAVELPAELGPVLRTHRPAVLGRTEAGRFLLDLRCVPDGLDEAVAAAVEAALVSLAHAEVVVALDAPAGDVEGAAGASG